MKIQKLKKVLVANRGEIAVRIIRALKELEIKSVSLFTEPDKENIWVGLADESYLTPDYLDQDFIVDLCKKTRCDAVHPGYGFLAENKDFVSLLENSGIKFIGPSSSAMSLSGDKVAARKLAQKIGVPVVPGSNILKDKREAILLSEKIGYPVLLKAVGGGGGKGMRVVNSSEELSEVFETAAKEAESAFSDSRLFLEKLIENPKHVEVQVISDEHGNYVHLFERDCSLQRRNQKVVEETPSPIPDAVKEKMFSSAINIMKAIGYTNAGTVEFIVSDNLSFYFIEINARVQVEHPITELVTGIDIVKEQFRIASGEKLTFNQSDIKRNGCATEFRIYAEDPCNDFIPTPGKINTAIFPSGPGIRVDTWVQSGCTITPHYDPLLAKLCIWARNRDEVIARAKRAFTEIVISGIKSNIPFFKYLLSYEDFKENRINTQSMNKIISDFNKSTIFEHEIQDETIAALSLAIYLTQQNSSNNNRIETIEMERSMWSPIMGWRSQRLK